LNTGVGGRDVRSTQPSDPSALCSSPVHSAMRIVLRPLMNDRYPDIRPTGVREDVSRLAAERAHDGSQ
jgi:hypothetical protein